MKTVLLKMVRLFGLLWARMQGAEVGERVIIHGLPILRRKGGRIVIENDVTINATTWSNPLVSMRTSLFAGPDGVLKLKAGSGISGCRVVAFSEVEIGEGSMIGAGSLICDSDMHEVPLGAGALVKSSPIRIGKRVFIGANCVVLKGVTIGDEAVVGAGSVVTRNVESHTVVGGNPAKKLR